MLAVPELPSFVWPSRWRAETLPFPHTVIHDVFEPRFYHALEDSYRCVLEGRWPFARFEHRESYDASAVSFDRLLPGPLAMLASTPWRDFLAAALCCPVTRDLSGALHHHDVGSRGGAPHTDLNTAWFVDTASGAEVNLPAPALCDYKTGRVAAPHLVARETVRAATAILYLNNPPWSPGDGGETGLYAAGEAGPALVATVPPVNNVLLLFVNSPRSFHAYLSNRRAPRDSIVFWLHRPGHEVASELGEESIRGWRAPAPRAT